MVTPLGKIVYALINLDRQIRATKFTQKKTFEFIEKIKQFK